MLGSRAAAEVEVVLLEIDVLDMDISAIGYVQNWGSAVCPVALRWERAVGGDRPYRGWETAPTG
jgi:hypothetical protein